MPGADTTKTDAVERLVDLAGVFTSEAESVVDAARPWCRGSGFRKPSSGPARYRPPPGWELEGARSPLIRSET
jgi:hypothetical protein